MTWRLRSIRGFVYALAAVQALQAGRHATDGFLKSYWVVTYDHGSVRRGLAGAVLQAFAGRATTNSIVVATWVVALVACVALLIVLELLLRQATPHSCALAVLLASSPFAIDYVMFQRRPDQLVVPVLVALGFALSRLDRRLFAACALVGVLFGVLTFVHEAVLLVGVPSAMLMVVVVLSVRRPQIDSGTIARALLLVASPAIVGGAIVAIFGTASASTVAALQSDARNVPLGEVTVLQYIDDSLRTSFNLVTGFPHRILISSLLLGFALTSLHAWWLLRWTGQHLIRDATKIAHRTGVVVLVIAAAATLLLFAIGVDWLRWFAAVGCALLIVSSFALLARAGTNENTSRSDRVTLPRGLPVVALYLAAIAPLPDFVFPKEALRVLVLKQ